MLLAVRGWCSSRPCWRCCYGQPVRQTQRVLVQRVVQRVVQRAVQQVELQVPLPVRTAAAQRERHETGDVGDAA